MTRCGKRAARYVAASAGATVTAAVLVGPASCSAAPPPPVTRPSLGYTVWTDKELTAPTKHGKLRRRKGGGGGSDDDSFGEPNDYGGDWNDGSDGGADDGNGEGGGDWNGSGGWNNHSGSGGGGGDWWGDGAWMDGSSGGIPEDGNVMWAWKTACGVAFFGSVQHIVERSLPLVSQMAVAGSGGRVAAGVESAGASCAGGGMAAVGEVVCGVEGAAACLASLTTAHLARHQPVLSISAC